MNEDPILVFNHIPKCYGQSLRTFFREFMATHTDYESAFGSVEDFRKYPYDPNLLVADDLLIGHFTSNAQHLQDRYPEVIANPRFHLFTFVRNPLDRQISQYYYSFQNRRNPNRGSMEEFPLSKALSLASNPIAGCFPCDESTVEATLSRYFFLGVTDRVDESMKVLIEKIYKIFVDARPTAAVKRMLAALELVRNKPLPHENRAKRDRQVDEISDDVLETFRRRNAVDQSIYQRACERLDADLAQLGLRSPIGNHSDT